MKNAVSIVPEKPQPPTNRVVKDVDLGPVLLGLVLGLAAFFLLYVLGEVAS